jgi:hypothetical protein
MVPGASVGVAPMSACRTSGEPLMPWRPLALPFDVALKMQQNAGRATHDERDHHDVEHSQACRTAGERAPRDDDNSGANKGQRQDLPETVGVFEQEQFNLSSDEPDQRGSPEGCVGRLRSRD